MVALVAPVIRTEDASYDIAVQHNLIKRTTSVRPAA
jgi:hypothetical protein